MEFKTVQDWIAQMAIRVVRKGQRNYFVAQDVAASLGMTSLLPGQQRLGIADFERLPIQNVATVCLTASGLQKVYHSASGILDIDGGMPLPTLNSESIAGLKADLIAQPESELPFASPIQEALMPYLASLIGPNNAVLVTPQLAKILLGGNLKNRPRKTRNFKRLCAQLRAGQWKVNGATISLSWEWLLIDGQHRLFAIIETGIPALCIIGYGFDPSVFATLDQGAKRTNADNLSIAGFANTRLLASAIGVYQAAKNGNAINNTNRSLEPEECVRFAEETENLPIAIKRARNYYRQGAKFVPDALIGGLMTRAMEIDRRAAKKFFDYLLNDNCKSVRPITVQKVRARLMSDYMDKSRKSNSTFVAALIIKAWNAYRQGQTLRTLKYVPESTVDGVTTGETYPVMI